jgi:hypothetical protein
MNNQRLISRFWLSGAPLDAWPPDDTDPADLPPPSAAELAAYTSLPAVVHRTVERLAYGSPLTGITSFDAAAERRRKDRTRMTTPTQAELERAQAEQPAFPDGLPDDRWTSEQLRAYAEHHEQLVQYEQVAPIRWDEFSPGQLAALSARPRRRPKPCWPRSHGVRSRQRQSSASGVTSQ